MLNDIAYPVFYKQPHSNCTAYEPPPSLGRKRVFLVAIQGEQFSPFTQGMGPLQRVHLMMVRPGETIEFDCPVSVLSPLPQFRDGMFPAYQVGGGLPVRPQNVRGEILRDASGRLYEKLGDQIWPLHQLVSGSQGEVLNLAPHAGRVARRSAAMAGESVSSARGFTSEISSRAGYNPVRVAARTGADSPSEPDKPSAEQPFRNLFPESGQWRLVKFGDFKEILGPQLAHPERLSASHRLACCLQIYEMTRTEQLETLASSLGDGTPASRLWVLTDDSAAKLGVSSLTGIWRRVPMQFRREPGQLLPGDRVFRLRLENDPTTDFDSPDIKPSQTEAKQEKPAEREASPDTAHALKTSIPKRFWKPWEFQLSYEEVLRRMEREASSGGGLRPAYSRLKRWLGGRNDLRRWQIRLCGKSLDQQLWGVPPPRGGLSHPTVLDWARKTLERAGYDPSTLLLEWEIFWRRKGI